MLVPVRNPANGSIALVAPQYATVLEGQDPPWTREEVDVEAAEADGIDVPQPPPRSGSKAAWVAYAVTQGADLAEAEASTRDELADKYGA